MAQGQEEHEGVQEEPEGISHLQLQEVSFHEFKDGATVSVLMEQPPLIYAVDISMIVTGEDKNQARAALRAIPDDQFRPTKFIERTPPGGRRLTTLVTYEDTLKLVMAIGGRNAGRMKTQFAKILTCYFVNNSRGQVVDILTSHPANGSSVEVEEPEVISHLQLKEVSFD